MRLTTSITLLSAIVSKTVKSLTSVSTLEALPAGLFRKPVEP